jgi:hypothetical protein
MRNNVIRQDDARGISFERGKNQIASVAAGNHQLAGAAEFRTGGNLFFVGNKRRRGSNENRPGDIFQMLFAREHSGQKLVGEKIKRKVR